MAAARQGADRQDVHEIIRGHAHEVSQLIKDGASGNDLLARLGAEPAFAGVDLNAAAAPGAFVGRAAEQVDSFLSDVVEPIRRRYAEAPEVAILRV